MALQILFTGSSVAEVFGTERVGGDCYSYKKSNGRRAAHPNQKSLEVFEPNSLLSVAPAEEYFDLYISVSYQPVRRPKSSAINSFAEAKFLLEYHIR